MKKLYEEANELAGREVEVEQTKDGLYIVLWMEFEKSPPPKGRTEQEALEMFIQFMLNRKDEKDTLPSEDTKENT